MIRTHNTNRILIDRRTKYSDIPFALKPDGLWYAENMEWVGWCEENMPDFIKSRMFSLEIDSDFIVKLDTKDKLIEFTDKYYKNHLALAGFGGIDWQAVKQDYKGFEAVPYFYDMRFFSHKLLWYYGLDVPSGCLWDLSALIKTKVVTDFKIHAEAT